MNKFTVTILSILLIQGLTLMAFAQEDGSAVLEKLKQGNERFVNGESQFPRYTQERRQDTAENGQHPVATVISCSDSRVPVEALFDMGIGDVFVIRVAGNVCQTDEIGSIEYGVEHLETPLMIVLGHTHCGAVTAVVSDAEVHGSIPQLVSNIAPVAEKINSEMSGKELEARVAKAVYENVWHQIAELFKGSPGVAARAAEGKTLVVGAVYDIATGKVEVMGRHPQEKELLAKSGEPEHH